MPLKIFNFPRDTPMCDYCTFTLLLHYDFKTVKYVLFDVVLTIVRLHFI